LATFTTNFSHIFTAHAQKRLFMSFRWNFWHHAKFDSLTPMSL